MEVAGEHDKKSLNLSQQAKNGLGIAINMALGALSSFCQPYMAYNRQHGAAFKVIYFLE